MACVSLGQQTIVFHAHTLIQMTLRQGFGDAAEEDGDYR